MHVQPVLYPSHPSRPHLSMKKPDFLMDLCAWLGWLGDARWGTESATDAHGVKPENPRAGNGIRAVVAPEGAT
jgi:hypothetical protein